jgi:hypothetical protein
MNGERPCWPIAPARGHDVSAGIKELSESCWNSDPAGRPAAQAIVKSLALEIGQVVVVHQVLPHSLIASNAGVSALQEASKKPASLTYGAVTWDRVSATTEAGRRDNGVSGASKS